MLRAQPSFLCTAFHIAILFFCLITLATSITAQQQQEEWNCVPNCNTQHGRCIESVCMCDEGYGGVDCSQPCNGTASEYMYNGTSTYPIRTYSNCGCHSAARSEVDGQCECNVGWGLNNCTMRCPENYCYNAPGEQTSVCYWDKEDQEFACHCNSFLYLGKHCDYYAAPQQYILKVVTYGFHFMYTVQLLICIITWLQWARDRQLKTLQALSLFFITLCLVARQTYYVFFRAREIIIVSSYVTYQANYEEIESAFWVIKVIIEELFMLVLLAFVAMIFIWDRILERTNSMRRSAITGSRKRIVFITINIVYFVASIISTILYSIGYTSAHYFHIAVIAVSLIAFMIGFLVYGIRMYRMLNVHRRPSSNLRSLKFTKFMFGIVVTNSLLVFFLILYNIVLAAAVELYDADLSMFGYWIFHLIYMCEIATVSLMLYLLCDLKYVVPLVGKLRRKLFTRSAKEAEPEVELLSDNRALAGPDDEDSDDIALLDKPTAQALQTKLLDEEYSINS